MATALYHYAIGADTVGVHILLYILFNCVYFFYALSNGIVRQRGKCYTEDWGSDSDYDVGENGAKGTAVGIWDAEDNNGADVLLIYFVCTKFDVVTENPRWGCEDDTMGVFVLTWCSIFYLKTLLLLLLFLLFLLMIHTVAFYNCIRYCAFSARLCKFLAMFNIYIIVTWE